MAERESLLTEYKTCNDRIEFSAMTCWQGTAILVGAALAAAAFFAGLEHGKFSTWLISIFVGAVIIFVLVKLRNLFNREEWRQKVIYKRMREIEEELKLEVTWDVYFLDLLKEKPEEFNRLTEERQKRYGDLRVTLPSSGPGGWRLIRKLPWAGVVLWALLMLAETVFYLMSKLGVDCSWFT